MNRDQIVIEASAQSFQLSPAEVAQRACMHRIKATHLAGIIQAREISAGIRSVQPDIAIRRRIPAHVWKLATPEQRTELAAKARARRTDPTMLAARAELGVARHQLWLDKRAHGKSVRTSKLALAYVKDLPYIRQERSYRGKDEVTKSANYPDTYAIARLIFPEAEFIESFHKDPIRAWVNGEASSALAHLTAVAARQAEIKASSKPSPF